MVEHNSIVKKRVNEVRNDFYFINPLEFIPEEEWDKVVWLQVQKTSKLEKNTNKKLRDFLNLRFILHQLDLDNDIEELWQRQSWYKIEDELSDHKLVMDSNYTIYRGEIERYCNRIKDILGYNYWAYSLDTLKIKTKGTGMIYDYIDGKVRTIGLDKNAIEDYLSVPLFFITAEKQSVAEMILEGLQKRGIDKGRFRVINTGRQSPTNVIRLLRRYKYIKNFHVYTLTDADVSGVQIYLDIKRHDQTKHGNFIESVGVNPDFMDFHGYKIDEFSEMYKTKKGKPMEQCLSSEYKKARKVLEDITNKDKHTKYDSWIEQYRNRKIELDSIIARKGIDSFVDYMEYIIGNSKWNLLRIGDIKPRDSLFYKEYKTRYNDDGTWYRTMPINPTIISYSIEPSIDRIYTLDQPFFINEFYEAKENSIITENAELSNIVNEIEDIVAQCRDINDKLYDITSKEEEYLAERKEQILKVFEDENPEIFDIDWDSLHDKEKITQLNQQIEMHEKWLRVKCTLKYRRIRKGLKNYQGSIKEDKPEQAILEKNIELAKYIVKQKERKNEKVKVYDAIIRDELKETEEYKNAEKLVKDFGEFTDTIEDITDNKVQRLEMLKNKMKEAINEWNEELEAIINENE